MKTPKKQNRLTFVKGILRRGSFHWKARNEALVLARVERGGYLCAMCGGIFKRQQVEIDHILPVVDPKYGFTTLDDYVERLYCDVEGFQIICSACHESKTRLEDEMREHYKTPKDIEKGIKHNPKKKKDEPDE